MPIVSVIVPNFNHARFLQKRLNSILNQSFKDFELIILDDASTDESVSIIQRYAGLPQVKSIIINANNSGSPFKQWVKGIEAASGDWIWIAESDDINSEKFLESLKPAFLATDCVLAYSELTWVNEIGETIKSPKSGVSGLMPGIDFIRQHMISGNFLSNSGMLIFRRKVLDNVRNNWYKLRFGGDYMLWAGILIQGNIYGTGQADAFFTRHSAQLSEKLQNSTVQREEDQQVLKFLLTSNRISSELIAKRITEELVRAACSKRNMSEEQYLDVFEAWLDFASKCEIRISRLGVYFQAKRRNLKHYLNRRFAL